MASDETPQPFAQAARLVRYGIQRPGLISRAELRGDARLDRLCLLEPVDEVGAIAQPFDALARGSRQAVEEVQGQVIADKEGRGARCWIGGHALPVRRIFGRSYVTSKI